MLNSEKKCDTCSYRDKFGFNTPCISCKAFSNWQSRYPDYWARISAIKDKQTSKGVEEYGQTLEENTSITPIERLTMLTPICRSTRSSRTRIWRRTTRLTRRPSRSTAESSTTSRKNSKRITLTMIQRSIQRSTTSSAATMSTRSMKTTS